MRRCDSLRATDMKSHRPAENHIATADTHGTVTSANTMNQKPKSTTANQVASVVNLPGYQIKNVLGKGGMAIVYLAVQESVGREVALKILVPDHTDDTFSERFLSEARIISSLNHPNIITVYDAGVYQGCHYMTMEFIPGKSLRDARDLLTRKQKIQIIKQVAQALDYAGKKGYVHRDIKPENILIHEDGRAILTDFGIARSLDATRGLTVTGKTIGTPYYMSPEQTKGIKVDHRSDIYSLGVVLFQALAGYLPYDGPSVVAIGIKHISDPIPDLPPGLEIFQPIINKAMAKNPGHRYANAGDLFSALDAITDADLDYIDAKVAAFTKKGADHQAKTLASVSYPSQVEKPASEDKVKIRAMRPTPPRTLDVTDTDDFKRLGRRRNWVLIMLLLAALAGAGYYQQDFLRAFWQQTVQPQIDQYMQQAQPVQPQSTPTPTHTEQPIVAQAEVPSDNLPSTHNSPDAVANLIAGYHAALVTNPNDQLALSGLEQAGKMFLLQIRTAMDEKNTTQARTLILEAKQSLTARFVPEQLLLIEEQLLRQEAIQSHSDKAKNFAAQGQYLSTDGQNARDEWLAVLSIDQNNETARQGLEAICQYYLKQANGQYKSGKLIEALASSEAGLSANKAHTALLALKTKLEQEIEKQNRILSFIIQAEAEFQAGKVISPENENAYDLYQQVLQEQPGNKKAADGMQKIEDYLNRQINTAIWENKLKQANTLMAAALQRFPNSARLDKTKIKLDTAIQSRAPRVTHILFSDMVLTSLLKEQGPVTPGKTLYVGFSYTNLTSSTTLLKAKLIDPEDRLLEKKLIVSDKSGEHIFTLEQPHQPFSPGNYRFVIELDGKPMLDTTFTITENTAPVLPEQAPQ